MLPIYDAMVLFVVFHCKKISDLNMRKPVCDVKPDEILVSDCFFSLLMFQEMKNHDFYRQCGMCKKINNSDIVQYLWKLAIHVTSSVAICEAF